MSPSVWRRAIVTATVTQTSRPSVRRAGLLASDARETAGGAEARARACTCTGRLAPHLRTSDSNPCNPARLLSPQEAAVSEEVELIVESLLGVLLRTILEISNRPQPAGPPMRLQVQDVTVRVLRAAPR